MLRELPLFPPSASTLSGDVDALYFFLLGVSGFFSLLICALIVVFVVRYRRRPGRPRPAQQEQGTLALEITWTVVPLAISLVVFVWGARVFLAQWRPPERALDVLVTAKQWMWKLQHPTGQREINELHVPLGAQVRLTMTSEDVIHSFFVPAFRMKRDVLPGRYVEAWFEATRPGSYHLFCAEYCGTQHSGMRGYVHVLEPGEYEDWLARTPAADPPERAGRLLFEALRCDACHAAEDGPRGPTLHGLFGREVLLRDGARVIADASHLRESIVRPLARVTAGWEPIMPTYEGQLTEEQLGALVAWLATLGADR